MGSVDEVLRLPDNQALVQVASSLAGTRGCQLDNDSYPSLDQIQLAHRSPNVPAPRIHGYFDCGSHGYNPVGVGYMLLDWIEGSPMMPWDQLTPAAPYRQKVLDQIADLILIIILECPLDDQTLFYGTPASNHITEPS
ncbi:unnamed protein product [Aspergillus oryzae]|nr:unnamed protein product [Aspergillus oryzae]GMF90013.1 unnamed protein product [Aspergillus oryzae]